jgi:hypothetical protein
VPELHLEVHYGVDLASVALHVNELCAALVDLGFGPAARVLTYERDRGAVAVDLQDAGLVHRVIVEKGCERGAVFKELEADSPPSHPRRFGDVMLTGQATGTWVGVRFDEYRPAMPMSQRWHFSNSLSCTTNKRRLGGLTSHEWIAALLYRLVANDDVLWGAAWNDDEFRWSNLHEEADGIWALGRDMRRSLPGLFWLNAFGSPYVNLIGHDALISAPAHRVVNVGSSIVVETYPAPDAWATDGSMVARDRVLNHIGRQYFYDRSAPGRDTVAPDFGLPELPPPRSSLQVLTTDGQTFTVLPMIDS